ncbi:MAG: hypothetical protein LBK25_01765 [Treponema sp.]|nr:hypothetical protein [Treponema sp.]
MKRVILAIIAITVVGCVQEELIPEDIKTENNGSPGSGEGGGDEEDLRGGKIVDAGLAFYNMPGGIFDLEEGTFDTPETFGRTLTADDPEVDKPNPSGGTYVVDEDVRARAKYIVRGPSEVSTSKLDSGGFTDVAFIYYDTPLTDEFTIRARVLITAKAGDSSSKGYFFGAFTGEPVLKADTGEVDHVEFKTGERGAGLLFRTNDTADSNTGGPAIRPYFKDASSSAGTWSTGPTKTSNTGEARPEYWLNARQPTYKQERILEVVRQQANRVATDSTNREVAFIFRIYDSKTGNKINEAFLDTASVHEDVRLGQKVYAGIALLGSSVEFSEISLWNSVDTSGEPIFQTPKTTAAYVDVESVKIGVSRDGGTLITNYANSSRLANCGRYVVTTVADAEDRPISLTAVINPIYADELFVDWQIVIDDSDGKIIVTPTDGDASTGWKKADVTITGAGSVIIMATSRDPSLSDHCLELVVNG